MQLLDAVLDQNYWLFWTKRLFFLYNIKGRRLINKGSSGLELEDSVFHISIGRRLRVDGNIKFWRLKKIEEKSQNQISR